MITLRASLPSLLVAISLTACGVDPLRELESAGHSLTLATRAQLVKGDVVPNSYIVAFRAPTGAAGLRFANYVSETRYHYSYLTETFLHDPKVKDLRYITSVDLANPHDPSTEDDFAPPPALRLAWDQSSLPDISAALARVDFVDEPASLELLKDWEARGEIWYAEPNYINRLMDNAYTQAVTDAYTKAAIHWHNTIKLSAALGDLQKGDYQTVQTPVIAVLDSGVDVDHPMLKGRIWQNPAPGQSGCGTDLYGCDTTLAQKSVLGSGLVAPYRTTGYGQDCPYPEVGTATKEQKGERGVCGHGTHVSGIIAANITDQVGGSCPVCQIMVIKIITAIGGAGVASDDAILTGFKYLTLFGTSQKIVRVANSSFGKYVRARSVALLVSVLKKKPFELLVIGAAGNDDSMARGYPAALNDAIAVASVTSDGSKAYYSNFGPWVDVAAPGGDTAKDTGILSTVPGGGVDVKQGTSMAAPVVSGIAGMILSVDPTRSFTSLRNSIINTADCRLYAADVNNGINRNSYYPKVQGENARRPLLGSGIVDAQAAIANKIRNDCAGAAVRRVDRNCSAIGTGQHVNVGSLWGLLLMPLLLVLIYSVSRRAQRLLTPSGGES